MATRRLLVSVLCGSFAAAWIAPALAQSPPDGEQAAIVAVVQGLFDSMAARDAQKALSLVVADGQLTAVRSTDGVATPRNRTLEAFANALPTQKGAMLERMWNPDVRVSGAIATLTTRYDFHLDGKFTHCGTDIFTLAKTASGWKITGGIYTVEPTGCEPSPLGEPR
jgi:hypothetical protein